MFSIYKPNRNEIDAFLLMAASDVFSYPDAGASLSLPPNGYTVDHNRIKLGEGINDWARAKQAIRSWKMFDFDWVELCWTDSRIEADRNVAILVSHFGFYSLNAARIVYAVDKPERFGFAYGTLNAHGESGEERFTVEMDATTSEVWYDLFAFSKPNHTLARLGYPLTRYLQKRFAADSMEAMQRAVK